MSAFLIERPLAALGIDPSSKAGARITGARLRAYWLNRGFDVPVAVELTVPAMHNAGKASNKPCYGAKLVQSAARRVKPEEVAAILPAVLAEIEVVLDEARRDVE